MRQRKQSAGALLMALAAVGTLAGWVWLAIIARAPGPTLVQPIQPAPVDTVSEASR